MTTRRLLTMLLALSLLGCADDAGGADAGPGAADAGPGALDAGPGDEDAGTGGPDSAVPTCDGLPDMETVTFATDDGVTLEADRYGPDTPSGDAVLLFHMIPPFNDRTNYPAAFIDALTERGLVVLNVDRRGAGGSEGDAMEAYQGPNGRLDVKAAIDSLASGPCAPERFVLVGASNGTTSVLDYTVAAAGDDAQADPAGLVFLTGGAYTEAQNAIDDERAVLEALPIDFVYSTAERGWSVGFETDAPAAWTFSEYDGGDHGTAMFTAVPASIEDVAGWIAMALE